MLDFKHSKYLPSRPREWIAFIAAGSALLFYFGEEAWFRLRKLGNHTEESIRAGQPIEMAVEKARKAAAALIPDIRRNREVIAREQVEVEELRAQTYREQKSLEHARVQLLALRNKLSDGARTVSNSQAADRSALRRQLQHRFAAYQSAEAALSARWQLLDMRQESLAKAEAVHQEILQKKRELESQVSHLEARVKNMKSTGIENDVRIDREKIAECDDLMRYLKKRLSVAERLTEGEAADDRKMADSDADIDDEVEKEVDRYFCRNGDDCRTTPQVVEKK